MPIIGFIMICLGFAVAIVAWGALAAKGWTGNWYEWKIFRRGGW